MKLTFSEHWTYIPLKTCLSYIILLDVSIFTMTDDEKERKMKLSIFEEFYLNLRRRSFKFINTIALDNLNTQTNKQANKNELHTNSCWRNFTNYTLFHWFLLSKTYRNSHSITWTVRNRNPSIGRKNDFPEWPKYILRNTKIFE